MDPQRTEPDHLLHITLQAEGLVFYELECVIGVCMGGKPAMGCIVQDQFAEVGGELLGDAVATRRFTHTGVCEAGRRRRSTSADAP